MIVNINYLNNLGYLIQTHLPETMPRGEDDERLLFLALALLARVKGEGTTLSDIHDARALWLSQVSPETVVVAREANLSLVSAEDADADSALKAAVHAATAASAQMGVEIEQKAIAKIEEAIAEARQLSGERGLYFGGVLQEMQRYINANKARRGNE